jgi:para-nitrobenzyl esterase
LNLTVGTIKGNVWDDGNEYLRIPFALAPRFSAPSILTGKLPSEPFDATDIVADGSAACMQPGPPYTPGPGKAYGVEDCLILNIYTPPSDPSGQEASPRPILLWIFGGGNTVDEILAFNGTKLAGRHNSIVASVNYRLGPLGFAAFKEDANTTDGTGNAALQDILAAAQWLQREAPNFGGNPNRIIAFGESSGASDSAVLTMVPAAAGLIQGSISESGGPYASSLDDAVNATAQLGLAVGCTGQLEPLKQCMQRKSAAEIVRHSGGLEWAPTVDGTFLEASRVPSTKGSFKGNCCPASR